VRSICSTLVPMKRASSNSETPADEPNAAALQRLPAPFELRRAASSRLVAKTDESGEPLELLAA
jgi:hypothetical protein